MVESYELKNALLAYPTRCPPLENLLSSAFFLVGPERLTSSLIKAWRPVLPFSGSLTSTPLTGRGILGLWTQRLGDEGGEEEMGPGERDGVWLTSVKRKRVTKMRKHKWRKRRRLARQSSDRK